MTVPRHTNDASHSRYYVFRHKIEHGSGDPISTMEHVYDIGPVGTDFDWRPVHISEAMLFAETQAKDVAQIASFYGKERNDGFTYCVGKVFVEVDGHFEIKVF